MVRGGKASSKRNFRKKGRSEEKGSDDSDEDYVVSDEGRDASDVSEYYCSSLDGCASEESLDSFIEEEEEEEEEEEDEEEEEYQGVRNSRRSKANSARKTSRKRGRITHEEQEEEEEEEEIRGVRNYNRSKAKSGICGQQKNASRTSQKRGQITYADQLEEEDQEMEEEEKVEKDREEEEEGQQLEKEEEGDEYEMEEEEEGEQPVEEEVEEEEDEYEMEEEEVDGDDEDEDLDCDDDEFTPKEEDYLDEDEEMRGRKKKNNAMKTSKKFLLKRASLVSTRGRKRRSSRASKKPLRNKRRKNVRIRRKVGCDNEDDFTDNGSPIRTTRRKKGGRKRRRLVLADSGSDCVSSGSSDFEYTISEEEREQVKVAKKLCGGLRTNLRSSSLLTKNEEIGDHDDLHQQRKSPGWKGKEKIEEPQGRKGKEKVEESKCEVGKQVCGICLSEEDKRRIRGVLNCCTHYFCFACINEWAKVESRCPLCKQRFKTISKPARSTAGVDLREVVIQVPERDQVYQPSEEELRSYIDPYEFVICSECHQGGDDGLMLLCDICDSPAHTYCVGLGREVPEGNWYCDGCRPVALGSSSSQVQECVADPRVTVQSLPVRPPPVLNVRESIDLNLMSSPRAAFNLGFGQLPSSRFTGRSAQGVSPVSGGGAPTLSERRWIHRQIQQLLSIDRMTSTTGRTDVISATSSTNNLYSSRIVQSRETATQHTVTQDVGTSYHTFFEERLCNNTSPLLQNGALWPGHMGTPPISDCEQVHQFGRSNIIVDGCLSPSVKEEGNFNIEKEQLQSMVKNHLMSLSQNIDLGHNTLKDIARSSLHTILAACGLEHKKSEVCTVPPPPVCQHIELMGGGQTSLIKGCCSSCFDSFVGDVVKRIMDTRISSQWLRLGL